MGDEVIASIAISFFVLNLAFGTVGFVIGISTNTFESFIGIKEQLESFNALGPSLLERNPSRDIVAEEDLRRDNFDCAIAIDGIEIDCNDITPLFPLYPSNATSVFDPTFGIFQTANFFGNIVKVLSSLWGVAILFYVIPAGLALGAFEMFMLIPPYVNGISPIGIMIFIMDAFVTIGFGLSFLFTMINRIKP